MKETDLKTMLRILRIDWAEFMAFIVGNTISTHDGESFYYECDIERFIKTKIKFVAQ